MKLSGRLTKLGAMAAIVMSLAAAAAPASADFHRGDAMNGRGGVMTMADRHGDRAGPPRFDHRGEFAWRDMRFRYMRGHEHCSNRHFERADFRR
jgi:hypothetical protein